MGIDIYARWKGQTKEDEDKQITGFDATSGDVGYLRESYGREPFATRYFLPEAFNDVGAKIPSEVLKNRLSKTLRIVRERYDGESEFNIWKYQKAYVDFLALCEMKEKETGESVNITASY